MGQRYEGTLVIQTKDSNSPTGNYVLSVLSDQAEEKDIINNKQGYNGTGNMITGTNKKGYAGQVFSETEMDSYLTEENVGRILQYLGQAEGSEGGTPAPVNPIKIGDTITKLYFNTSVTPDFSLLDWSSAETDSDGISVINILYDDIDFIQSIMRFPTGYSMGDAPFSTPQYAISVEVNDQTIVYATSEVAVGIGLQAGWQLEEISYSGAKVISQVNQQDVWGAYISKDGQWIGGAKYTSGQVYKVVQNGDIAELKEIQY